MGFADAYLLKAGLREPLVTTVPDPGLKIIVTIPVHNESGLKQCLDSLFQNSGGSPGAESATRVMGATGVSGSTGVADPSLGTPCALPFRAEVLILINAPADDPRSVHARNLRTLESARHWISSHPHPSLSFHIWLDHGFGKKEAGVGMARKVLMDEAVRRFSAIGRKDGIIASLDADVMVDPGYLETLVSHFEGSGDEGCSVYFEHPLSPEEDPFGPFDDAVYEAISGYELHLRYYLNAVRSTGYPHAFHTVGSAFVVRADVYCKEGGMNRRQGGEDFYFIQKVARRGRWSECNATRVLASPRPSDRVPFGTGPVVGRFLKDGKQQATYHPEPFGMLAGLFSGIGDLYHGETAAGILQGLPAVLSDFLEAQDFSSALEEIRQNCASPEAFTRRFWAWFNMFRIMKFLHHARERGYADMEVSSAATLWLEHSGRLPERSPAGTISPAALLMKFREMDRFPET
jgi:hypothetical protein